MEVIELVDVDVIELVIVAVHVNVNGNANVIVIRPVDVRRFREAASQSHR